ncbi:High mobility group B protein 9 [Glycine max]|nr:High mobility group B protein 9 [Glycine max]
METKEERKMIFPSPSETQLMNLVNVSITNASAGESHVEQCSITICTLLQLQYIFNVRETLLDLYLFYLEVTRRGGYHPVGREKKWGEVVFALKLEGNSMKLCAQVEKLYAHILYQFEKLSTVFKGPLQKKRNSTASLPYIMDIKDGMKVTEISKDYSCHMTSSPPGRKTAYQIFLKHECARLKTCSQALDGQKILRLAIDTWRNMSEIEKQPYVEESKKKKEEIKEAMNDHNKQQITQDTIREEKWHSLSGDYLVTSQPETDNSLFNKATVGLALKMTEKAPTDPSYLMDWNAFLFTGFSQLGNPSNSTSLVIGKLFFAQRP